MNTLTRSQSYGGRLLHTEPQPLQFRRGRQTITRCLQYANVGVKLAAVVPLVWASLFAAGQAQARDACYYANRGEAWDNCGDYDMAIANYTQSLALDPNQPVVYNNRGYDWYKQGNYDQAIADYNQALAMCPSYGAAYSNRGVAWDEKGDLDRAFADYNQALAVNPSLATAYSNRGVIHTKRGEYDKANADYYQALAICPTDITELENLAFFQATCPDAHYRDAKKAFDNANRAYQLANGTDAYFTSNALAAVYAESGDFEKAIIWQAKVVDLAPPEDKPMQTSRLELFKQHKPYRSEQKSS